MARGPTFRKRSTEPPPIHVSCAFQVRDGVRANRRSPGRTGDATQVAAVVVVCSSLGHRAPHPHDANEPTNPSLGLILVEVQARDQLQASGVIEQARHRKAISALIAPHRGLRLGRIAAIDRPYVTLGGLHMRFHDLDRSSGQGPLHRRAAPCVRRHTCGDQLSREASDDPLERSPPMPPVHPGDDPHRMTSHPPRLARLP
jgi:hypothetical protein